MMTDLAYPRIYPRVYPRYLVQYPLIFGGASGVGEGHITNLSFNGCSILCDRTLDVGATVCLGVFLPDHTQALSIDGGTIRWADDGQFGVEFQCLSVRSRQLLNRILRQALILDYERTSAH